MKKRTIKNLAICFLIAFLGIFINFTSFKLFNFRFNGGWSFIIGHHILFGIMTLIIIFIEASSTLIGAILLFLGSIGVYNNAKKMQ